MEKNTTIPGGPVEIKQPKAILIIDDDENWRYISNRIIKKVGLQSQVLTATNGQEALKTLRSLAAANSNQPELIFLDIKMPVMDGFDFLEELGRSPEIDLKNARIYMCSSSFHPRDRERAKGFPIAGFVNKPLTQDILKEILAF